MILGGRYRVARRLGAGGMGTVYEAVQIDLGRRVAVKVLDAVDEESIARFRDEALIAASLSHPNIVQVTELAEEQPPWLVMELLEGRSLAQVLTAEGPLARGRSIEIVRQILAGLDFAHGARVVHRDIKPSNIWISETADAEIVKILDFGIARLVDDTVRRTKTGMTIGTPAYMAPELLGGGEPSASSDVFSVGICLYEMLTGAPPFRGTREEIASQVIGMEPPAVRGVGAGLAGVVAKALAKAPGARFASAREMRVALDAVRSERAPLPLPKRRGSLAFVLGVMAALSMGSTIAIALFVHPPVPVPVPPETHVDAASSSSGREMAPASLPSASVRAASASCTCVAGEGAKLCPRHEPTQCSCIFKGPLRSDSLCPPDKSGQSKCASFSFVGEGLRNGASCTGYLYRNISFEDPVDLRWKVVAGSLAQCEWCPSADRGSGVPGAPCDGFDANGRALQGTLRCR